MFNNSNGYSLSDIAAATKNNNNDGFGGFGGDGAWIILLFIIVLMGGGWNNNGWGNNGGGNGVTYVTSDVQRGFDQAAVTSGINDLATGMCNGFSNVQQSLCNGFAGVTGAVTNGFAQAEIANNARQIADMNQNFAMQTALMQQLNGMAMTQQNCCCENRAATADLKYTVATEACADRAAVDGALRDVTAQGIANTQALLNAVNGGIQSIKDELFRDRLDEKDDLIAQLRQENLYARGQASQIAQNQQIVDSIYNRLDTCPVGTTPVYGRTPIFTCNNNGGCGCGGNAFYN